MLARSAFFFNQLPLYSAGPYGEGGWILHGLGRAGDGGRDHVEEAGVELHREGVGEQQEEEVGRKE